MSAEAMALQAELEMTSRRHRASLERCDEADAAMIWPEVPEALFWRSRDDALFPIARPGRHSGTSRLWWGYPGDLEALQARRLVDVNDGPIRDARARRAEIEVAHAGYQAAQTAAEQAAGLPEAEAEYEEAAGAFFDVVERLIAMRTADPAIMRLKAIAMVEVARRQGGHEQMLEHLMDDDSSLAVGLGASLLRDFIGQLGGRSGVET